MSVEESIACLEQLVGDPRQGLPESVFLFLSRIAPMPNVDLLIQDETKGTLLTWRDDEFFGQGWHVPGGMIRYKELAATRVKKCAQEELGCGVTFDPTPIKLSETIREPRTRGHFISMLYRCRLSGELDPALHAGEQPRSGEWKWHRRCPDNLLSIHQIYAEFFE